MCQTRQKPTRIESVEPGEQNAQAKPAPSSHQKTVRCFAPSSVVSTRTYLKTFLKSSFIATTPIHVIEPPSRAIQADEATTAVIRETSVVMHQVVGNLQSQHERESPTKTIRTGHARTQTANLHGQTLKHQLMRRSALSQKQRHLPTEMVNHGLKRQSRPEILDRATSRLQVATVLRKNATNQGNQLRLATEELDQAAETSALVHET